MDLFNAYVPTKQRAAAQWMPESQGITYPLVTHVLHHLLSNFPGVAPLGTHEVSTSMWLLR